MAEKTETEKLDLILSTLLSFSVRLESLEKKSVITKIATTIWS